MLPNQNNWHKKFGTFMFSGSTGFKLNFSSSRKSFIPKTASAFLMAAFSFMGIVAFNPLLAAVFAIAIFSFQMFFSTSMNIFGNSPPSKEEDLLKAIDDKISKSLENFKGSPEQLKDIDDLKLELKKLNIDENPVVKQLRSDLDEAGLKLKGLLEDPARKEPLNLQGQIKSWMETNKTAITHIRAGQKADLTPLTIKVNSPMTPANSYNGSAYLPIPEFQAGANEIVRVQPTFWDYLKKGRSTSATYVWVNKKNPLGAAGFIGPGVAKPGISFEIATETSNAKKIAVSEKCATELLEDIDGMASWIEQEIRYQLNAKMNTTLMTGTSSSTVPAGIQTISVPYTLTTVETTNANRWDAIRACVAQLRSGNLQGTVTAFVNPVDYANMVLTKAQSQGQLFMPAETGATIVEDNNVPVGYVQVALLDYYKVLIYKDFSLAFGWENDDFTKNLVTTIGEMRIHQFFSENYTGAFIYDTFANIQTAITVTP